MLFEPHVIETYGRGNEKSFPLFSRLLKDRVILLSGEVEDDMSTIICSQLLFLEQQDKTKPIFMYINSPGGSVTAGLAIADTMNFIDCPVYTIGMGQCCSMGAYLLTVGEKRFSLPNTRIMYHSVSGGAGGTIHDMEIQVAEVKFLQKLLIDKLYEKSNKTKTLEEIKAITARDWFMSAEETVAEGLIDHVLYNRETIKKLKLS